MFRLRAVLRARFWAVTLSVCVVLGFLVAAAYAISRTPDAMIASTETLDRPELPPLLPAPLPPLPPVPSPVSGSVPPEAPVAPTRGPEAPAGVATGAPAALPGVPLAGPPSPFAPRPTPTAAPTGGGGAAPPTSPPEDAVVASNDDELSAAITAAASGTTIRLADGVYTSPVTVTARGTADRPIVITGTRRAVFRPSSPTLAVWRMDGAAHVRLDGFTVRGGIVGVLVERANGVTLRSLAIEDTAADGVRVQSGSGDTVIENSRIRRTGRSIPAEGAGVAIGANGQLSDGSNGTIVRGNTFDDTRAEHVRVYAGTAGGVIAGNIFGTVGARVGAVGDAWVDVAGNGYRVSNNRGSSRSSAVRDGLVSSVSASGWGERNVFSGNHLTLRAEGYGIFMDGGAASGGSVTCDNVVSGAKAGTSNISCA